jgi:hypothetical protein
LCHGVLSFLRQSNTHYWNKGGTDILKSKSIFSLTVAGAKRAARKNITPAAAPVATVRREKGQKQKKELQGKEVEDGILFHIMNADGGELEGPH